ncbi:MAG: fibronectin type III domain-containing protein [Patescibacteria group bacterium]|nr:fibronectin type III domain-containing protein [Patescibacteria group bacterium]
MRNKSFGKFLVATLLVLGLIAPTGYTLAQDPLIIANLRVSAVSDEKAIIEWTTNYPSSGEVWFGLNTSYGSRYGFEGESRTSHSITLDNLKADTVYHFRVVSSTAAQEVRSFDQTFTTAKAVDRDVPIVTDIAIPFQGPNSVVVQWLTNEASDSQVLYGPTTKYTMQAREGAWVTAHDIIISGLQPLTTYHFQVKSKDDGGNVGISEDYTFRTISSSETIAPLQLVNIRPVSANDSAITDTSAEISWRTTTLADGVVFWGTTSGLGMTVKSPPPRDFTHAAKLVNLQPATTYYFQVRSADIFRQSVTSPVFSFTTRGGYTTPLPSGQVLGVSTEQDLMFYASFDHSLDADFSLGDSTAGIFGVPALSGGKGGVRGGAVDLTNGSYLNFDADNNLLFSQGTITFWYKPTFNPNDNQWHPLFLVNNSQTSYDPKLTIAKFGKITSDRWAPLNTSNMFAFGVKDTGNTLLQFVTSDYVKKDQWQFVAATWQYYDGRVRLYYNASHAGVQAMKNYDFSDSTLGGIPFDIDNRFNIGSAQAGGAGSYIDEVAIFGRVLSENEIKDIYSRGIGRYIPQRGTVTPTPTPASSGGQVLGASTLQYTQASALLKAEGQPDVYAIMNGQKHIISGPSSFAAYGYRWSDVRVVKPEVLEKIPDARLVRTPSDPAIYYLYLRPQREWLKLAIPSPTVFVSYPGNFWGNIITINEIDLANYPNVQLIKADDESQIYLLDDGKKRPISSDAAFDALALPRPHVATVSRTHLDFYPMGEPVQ